VRRAHAGGVKVARATRTRTAENSGLARIQSTASDLLDSQINHVAAMNQPFQPLNIAGLIEDRCHLVDSPVVRIHLQLSQPPPLGWSHLFHLAWLSLPHPVPRKVGIDGDSLWIECVPYEFMNHKPELEAAMAQANAGHIAALQRQESLRQQRLALEAQTRSQLATLAEQLNPPSFQPPDHSDQEAQPIRPILAATRSMWRNLRTLLMGRCN